METIYKSVADFKDFLQNPLYKNITIFAIIIILIVMAVRYFNRKARENPYLIKGTRDATKPVVISGRNILRSCVGKEFTFSLWINVKDWGYNFGKAKHILHVGDENGDIVAPGIWLHPKNNNLIVRMDSYDRFNNVSRTNSGRRCQNWLSNYPHKITYTPENTPGAGLGDHNYCRNPDNTPNKTWCYTEDPTVQKEYCDVTDWRETQSMNPNKNLNNLEYSNGCDIINIPVQRWVHIAVVLINKTIDVYINGKLARSCTMQNVPKLNNGNIYICQDGGFEGDISDVLYSNRALSVSDIFSLYLGGYNRFTIYDKVAKIIPKVDVSLNVDYSVNKV